LIDSNFLTSVSSEGLVLETRTARESPVHIIQSVLEGQLCKQ